MALRSIHLKASIALLGATLIIASSSTPIDDSIYRAKSVGEVLPIVKITNEKSPSEVQAEGASSLTLLHFWAAYDAGSRAQQLVYQQALQGKIGKHIAYQSVSLDTDADIYKHSLALDGITDLTNYRLVDAEHRQQVIELFGLNEGLHSFLVDASGRILAVDPSVHLLAQFIND